jgi:hypothetical protein
MSYGVTLDQEVQEPQLKPLRIRLPGGHQLLVTARLGWDGEERGGPRYRSGFP